MFSVEPVVIVKRLLLAQASFHWESALRSLNRHLAPMLVAPDNCYEP